MMPVILNSNYKMPIMEVWRHQNKREWVIVEHDGYYMHSIYDSIITTTSWLRRRCCNQDICARRNDSGFHHVERNGRYRAVVAFFHRRLAYSVQLHIEGRWLPTIGRAEPHAPISTEYDRWRWVSTVPCCGHRTIHAARVYVHAQPDVAIHMTGHGVHEDDVWDTDEWSIHHRYRIIEKQWRSNEIKGNCGPRKLTSQIRTLRRL